MESNARGNYGTFEDRVKRLEANDIGNAVAISFLSIGLGLALRSAQDAEASLAAMSARLPKRRR